MKKTNNVYRVIALSEEAEDYFKLEFAKSMGFIKVIREDTGYYKHPFPDFWCIDSTMRAYRVEVEKITTDFELHNHSFKEVDKIVVAEDNLWLYPGKKYPVDVVEMPGFIVDRDSIQGRTKLRLIKALCSKDGKSCQSVLSWFSKTEKSCWSCNNPTIGRNIFEQHRACLEELERMACDKFDVEHYKQYLGY